MSSALFCKISSDKVKDHGNHEKKFREICYTNLENFR